MPVPIAILKSNEQGENKAMSWKIQETMPNRREPSQGLHQIDGTAFEKESDNRVRGWLRGDKAE